MKQFLLPETGRFYKACLHLHSTCSDGLETPADIKKMFEDKDYVNFTKMIPNASPATKETIVAVAVDMRISDKAFVELIKKYCDVNIIEAISVQVQAEEN